MIGIGGATRFRILRSQNEEDIANNVFSNAVKSGVLVGIVLISN